MGIVHGRAQVARDFADLQAVSEAGVQLLWVAFNELADGYALDPELWAAILWDARTALPIKAESIPKEKFEQWCGDCFRVIDTDENGLIDALEVLAIICVLSTAAPAAKLAFLFTLYDFDARGALALDELALLVRTTSAGLVKVCAPGAVRKAPESTIERIAQNAFSFEHVSASARLSRQSFEHYFLTSCVEAEAWLAFFEATPTRMPEEQQALNKMDRDKSATSLAAAMDAQHVEPAKVSSKKRSRRRPRHWENSTIDLEPSNASEIVHDDSLAVPVNLVLDRVLGFNRGAGVALVSPTPPKISSSESSSSSSSSSSSKHATSDIDEVSNNAELAIFATGSTVVLSSLHETNNEKLTQAFYRGHTSNVSALATDGVFVASASSNEVHVWHAASGQLTRNLTISGLMRAPSHVAFGPQGILVVCGRGIEPGSGYVTAVFDHGKASHHVFADRIVGVSSASGVAVASAYLFAVISRDANTPFVYERAENVPWRRRNAILSGSFGESLSRRHDGLTSITCLVPDYLGADENTHGLSCFYTGSATGDLVEWVGRAVSNHLPAAHEGQVTALTCAGEHRRVVSCGSDGALKVWSHEFSSPVHVLQLGRTVTSFCFSFQSSMLVAEMRCAMEDSAKAKGAAGAKNTRRTDEHTDLVIVDLHIDSPKPEPHTFTLMPSLRKAHFQSLRSSGELVNMRPQGLYRGGPRTAGVHIPLKPQLQDGPSGEPPAFAIAKCGKLLAFAQQGNVLLYAMRAAKRDAAVVARLQDFKSDTPAALCFSPDTQTLVAVLPGEASIFVYDVGELRIQLERANLNNKSLDLSDLIICRGKISIEDPLAAAVTGAAADKDASANINIDFSDDARFARIEFTSAKVIVFVDIRAAATVADIATLKDQAWDAFTCTFAWGAHGAWADIDGKHDLCATCVLTPSHEPKTKLLCAGTNAGTLEVRRWPCTSRKKAKKMTNATSAYSKAVSQVLMIGTAEAAEGEQTSFASFEADLGSYFLWRIEPQASASNAAPGPSLKNHETTDDDGDLNEILETKGEIAAGEEKEERELEVHQDPFAQDPNAHLWRDLIESGEIAPPTKNGKAKLKKKAKTKARQLANKDAPLWFTELEEQPPLAGPDYAREAPSSLTLETVHGVGHVLRSILYAGNERTGRFDLVYPAGELVIIVDPEQGTQRHVSVGSRITCVSSRCVHNLVAVGCENGQVALVNIKEPNMIAQLPDCGADGGPVWAVALGSSGKYFAVCAGKSRRELQLWPVSGCVRGPVARQLLPPFATAVIGLEFLSCPPKEEQQQQQQQTQENEAMIAFGEEFACVLSHVNRDYLRVSGLYQVPGTAILSAQVLSTGMMIFGDAAGHLHICDVQTLSPRGVLERAHARSITAVQEVAQTKDLVSAGADGFVKVWQIPADVDAASISSLDPKLMIDTSTLTNCLKATPNIYGLSTSPYGMANKHNRAVVALSLGQILQIDLETGLGIGEGVLTQGFGAAAGSGCAGCHPFKSDVVCAAGADRWLTLHLSGKQTLRVPLDGAARSLAWSPDGCHVAVGMTGSFVAVYSVDEGNVTRIFEQGDPGAGGGAKGKKIGVAQVRYSQDGRLLGYISGSKIYIALVDEKSNTYETFAELEDGDSLLVAMEFTQNSKFVRAVDTNGKLVEMDVRAQAPMREKAKRKAQWVDRAVPAGADIRSLWIADETTQIVAMRSFHDDAETMLVLGSAPHVVRASHLPLPGTKDPLAGYSGFPAGPPGSVICSIVVSPKAKRVVTTDDVTGTLRVWRLDPPRPAAAAELNCGESLRTFSLGGMNGEREKEEGDEQDEEARSETENDEIDTTNLDDLVAAQFSVAQDWIDHEEADTESIKTRDMARDHMNLSQDALREASKATRPVPLHERGQLTGAPQIKMELEHVFGRVSAGRGPFLTREGTLVSTAGRFGLESSLLGERLQTHLYVAPASETFSICETTALAVCSRVGLAATAACVNNDTSALIRVWHTGSCSSVAVHNFETGGRVVSLAFSEDAQRLAGVILSSTGSAELFVLCAPACEDGQGVWLELSKSGFLEMAAPLHVRPQPGVWCAFVGRYSVVVGGSEFLGIARDVRKRQAGGLVCYGTPKPSEGAVQSDHSRVVFTCGAGLAEPQVGIVGDNCGSLLVYENGRRTRTIRHACEENAYIRAAASCPGTSCFVTGDSRGILRVLSSSLEALHTLNHTIDLTACDVQFEDRSRITSVDVDRHCSRIVVGMASGEIVLASTHTGGASLVEAPQCSGESFGAAADVQAWAMTVNPSNPDHVCVTSDDGFVRVWDLATKELVACEEIDQDGAPAAIRAAAWSPDGLLIAIGYGRESEVANKAKAGAFAVLNATTLDVAYHGRDSKEWITDAKFSPTGTHLALASMDGHVYVYDARNGFKLHYVSENLKTGVVAIDYAGSSLFLRATTQDVRHVVLNATSGEPVEDEEKTKDQNWTTSECMTSWGFGGFAAAEIPGGSVLPLCTAREKTLNVALSGGSHGTVQLANFPYLTTARHGEAERFKSMAAHSGAVSRILTVPSAASDLAASDSAPAPSQKNKLPAAGVAKILTLGSRDCVLLEWKLVANSL